MRRIKGIYPLSLRNEYFYKLLIFNLNNMKITLDITKLLDEGKITQAEYDRLTQLSSKDTGSLGINILVAFGVLAITGGVIALVPSLFLGTILALTLAGIGLLIIYNYQKQWGMLGNILLLIGSLGTAASLIQYFDGETSVFLFIAILFIIAGVIARSGLLMALSALSIAPLIKMGTFYGHASYFLFVEQPIITIFVYGLLSYGTYFLSTKLEPQYERLAIIFSRTSLLMVNFGFWVGSLWGDKVFDSSFTEGTLALLWAGALIATGIWATKKDKRFVVNTVATFGAIHFYTQWFEILGANPIAILLAGIIAIVISIGLWKYNKN